VRRFLAAMLPAVLGGCAATPGPPIDVAVTKSGESWYADFHFPRRARAWGFVRSSLARVGDQPWRPQSWTIDTPGVRLERRGHYDVLAREDGDRLPHWVRIRFAPFAGQLLTDPDAALAFSDGSIALFTEQFDAFPLRSAARAERLPVDLSGTRASRNPTRVTFADYSGAVLYAGRRVATVSLDDDEGTYILFGAAEPSADGAMTMIIDPKLPGWVAEGLRLDTPDILDRYAAALGPLPAPPPALMVSWAGPTPRLTSMRGSVQPGLMAMTYEGDGVLLPSEALFSRTLWFIAHEGAHFWLGEAVTYQYSRDAWITEGGADLLAFRTVAEVDPGYDARAALQEAVEECVALTAGHGVASAEQRGEQRAYYACGALFGLAVEAASDRPFSEFVRRLIAENRADRVVTRADWMAAAAAATGDPALVAAIGRLLDRGAEDPKVALAALFTRAGIAFVPAADGTPVLQ